MLNCLLDDDSVSTPPTTLSCLTFTSNSNGQFYTWDVENRLTLATDGFNTLGTYTYDALGRRTSKTVGANTTVFVSDGLQEVAEYVNGALCNGSANYPHFLPAKSAADLKKTSNSSARFFRQDRFSLRRFLRLGWNGIFLGKAAPPTTFSMSEIYCRAKLFLMEDRAFTVMMRGIELCLGWIKRMCSRTTN